MTDTLARPHALSTSLDPSARRVRAASASISWASPGEGLWVASRRGLEGTTFLGFVEETLGEFVAVDGAGTSLGRFADLLGAQSSFSTGRPSPALTTGPLHWADAGARIVPRSSLRLG